MVLQRQTNSGLTYGQILATVTILIALFTIGLQANIRMRDIEIQANATNTRVEFLEKNLIETAEDLKVWRQENREDHQTILKEIREQNNPKK